MSSPQHFLLVAGAWHTTECWERVAQHLKAAGYASTAIALPSIDRVPGVEDDREDIAHIHDTTKQLSEEGKDVVVVLHSVSAKFGADAVKGFDKDERKKEGLKGGVVRLVYLAAFMALEGHEDAFRDDPAPPLDWVHYNAKDNTVSVSVEDAKRVLYNDLPDAEAEEWGRKLQKWSNGPRFGKVKYAPWRIIPTTFVICTKDLTPFGQYARAMLDGAKSSGTHRIDTEEVLDAGHVPMIGKPGKVAEVLVRAAKASA